MLLPRHRTGPSDRRSLVLAHRILLYHLLHVYKRIGRTVPDDSLTIRLNPQIHLRFRRVWNRVAAELDFGTGSQSAVRRKFEGAMSNAHFFVIMYRSAFPKVWSSWSNWNEAAVSLAPGS